MAGPVWPPGPGSAPAGEAAAKRDLPGAITIGGSLQGDLAAALDALLHRAQQAGTVGAGITADDLLVLLKSLLNAMREVLAGEPDPARRDRLLAVITDRLRQPS
jgi:hypothetical protein